MTIFKTVAITALVSTATVGGVHWWQAAHSSPTAHDPRASSSTHSSNAATATAAPTNFLPSATPPSLAAPGTATADLGKRDISVSLRIFQGSRSDYDDLPDYLMSCLPRVDEPAGGHDLTTFTVHLAFLPSASGASLHEVSVVDAPPGMRGLDAYRTCVRDGLATTAFRSGTGDVDAVVKFRPRGADAQADQAYTLANLSGPRRGPDNARIRLVEFTDLSACPTCDRTRASIDALIAAHPDAIELVIEQIPTNQRSLLFATALAAASMQKKFWPMYDALLAERSDAPVTDARMIDVAAHLGLNVEQFKSALDTDYPAQMVDLQLTNAKKLGVTMTPTVFIDGEKLEGAQPFDAYRAAIDRGLAAHAH